MWLIYLWRTISFVMTECFQEFIAFVYEVYMIRHAGAGRVTVFVNSRCFESAAADADTDLVV